MAANDRPADIQWLVSNVTDEITGYISRGREMGPPAFVQDGVLMGPDGAISVGGLPETSPGSGIYIAEVANKVDTYANLMAYAGANGQISVASDVDVMFKHSGTAGTADIYCKDSVIFRSYLGVTTTAITSSAGGNTYYPLTLNNDDGFLQLLGAPAIWTAGAPTEIVLPALAATTKYLIEVEGLFEFAASATGTNRKLRIEYWNGVVWNTGVLLTTTDIARDATLSATNPVSMFATITGQGTGGATRFRVVAGQDSGGNLNLSASDVMRVVVYLAIA